MNSKRPAVSIVMPVYNAGQYLVPALKSIYAQTFEDWELIAVDDASTDGSWECLNRLDDPRVRVFRNKRNRKHPGTLNRAVGLARGKYFARMDADDIIVPERLEKQVHALETQTQVDVLGCGTFLTDLHLNVLRVRRPPTAHRDIVKRPYYFFPITYGALVGRAEWWRKWPLDPRAVHPTSFDLYFRSYRTTVFGNIQDLLYAYRFVGHTRKLSKLCMSVYHRMRTLVKHGLGAGRSARTLVALGRLLPLPAVFLLQTVIGSSRTLKREEGVGLPTPGDLHAFRTALEVVTQTEVPLRSRG